MDTAYGRRLVLFYLSNAVSGLQCRSREARNLAEWLLEHGEELNLQHLPIPGRDSGKERARRRTGNDEPSPLDWQCLREALREEFVLVRRARPDRTARRLRRLAKAVRLTRTDVAIVELLLRLTTNPRVESMYHQIFAPNLGGTPMERALPCLLGVSSNAFWRRFASDAPLVTSGLVSREERGRVELVGRLTRLHWLPNKAGSDVRRLLLDEAKPSELKWSDFDHVAEDRDHVERILKGALRTGEKGINLLVYGPPGTGKTEFCKTPAARLKAPLYVVGEEDSSGNEPEQYERLQELRLAQRLLAGGHNSILLFDEMEDLLSGRGGVLSALFGSRRTGGRPAEGSKVYMNRLLEQTPVPTLWTSDVARQTSPVLLRRMTFALELRQPPPTVRARIWARQLAHHGIESTEEDPQALAREFDVTPGVASAVTAAARVGGATIADVRRGARSLARVLSGDRPPTQGIPDRYDPRLIRADVDVVRLADRLAASETRHFSLCLQGPAGTGKSAFVRHLADRLGLEVIQKRASDLMSMWVGGTEGNIAEA